MRYFCEYTTVKDFRRVCQEHSTECQAVKIVTGKTKVAVCIPINPAGRIGECQVAWIENSKMSRRVQAVSRAIALALITEGQLAELKVEAKRWHARMAEVLAETAGVAV